MYRIYKGQPFTIASTEIRRGQWDLQILIMGEKNMQFSIESRFKTLREAEQYGVVWVKQWIDEGKPALEQQTEKSDASLASVLRAVREGGFLSRCRALLEPARLFVISFYRDFVIERYEKKKRHIQENLRR